MSAPPGAHSTGFGPPSLLAGAHSTGFGPPSLLAGAHSTGFGPPSLLAGAHSTALPSSSHVGGAAQSPRRTDVYIDSWNLYFGCLKGTPYRWINVGEMVRRSMPAHYQMNRIRFFTARVSVRPGGDSQAPVRQATLFRALQTLPNLSMHFGNFLTTQVRAPLVNPPPVGSRFVEVYKTEEKGSDVNIATYLLVDGYENDFEAAVVISDDSDLVEPIKVVRQRLRRHVTVLSPRGRSRELALVATRFRKIDLRVLAASQFPPTLSDANGIFSKPVNW